MRTTSEVRADLTPRLKAAGQAYRDAVEAAALAQRQRDELIVQAADEGMTQGAIARAVGLKSQSRVVAILANSQPDAAAMDVAS